MPSPNIKHYITIIGSIFVLILLVELVYVFFYCTSLVHLTHPLIVTLKEIDARR